MKIKEIYLKAFGPFTECKLELDDRGLVVIYGPNEAGKSSALRALTAAFYGIPIRTTDNFRHDNKLLRIGLEIVDAEGKPLVFLRRKANTGTLLDFEGKVIADSILAGFLGGVNREIFEKQFGITYESLVSGGNEMLEGGGDLGQLLFSASTGMPRLLDVLKSLEDGYSSLYTPRSKSQRINKTLQELKDNQGLLKDTLLKAEKWKGLETELRRDDARRDDLDKKILHFDSEGKKLERFLTAGSLIAQRAELNQALKQLGPLRILKDNFGQRRVKAMTERKKALEDKKKTTERIIELQAVLQTTPINMALLERESSIADLKDLKAVIAKAEIDRSSVIDPKIAELERAAASIVKEIDPGLNLEEAEQLRIDIKTKEKIQELCSSCQGYVTKADEVAKRVEEQKQDLQDLENDLTAFENGRNSEELEGILQGMEADESLEKELDKAKYELQNLQQEAEKGLPQLKGFGGSLADIESLAVPEEQTLNEFKIKASEAKEDIRNLIKDIEKAEKGAAEARRKLARYLTQKAVPTEAELVEFRDKRDKGWGIIKQGWLGKEEVSALARAYDPELALPEAFEHNMGVADQKVDRMRENADFVQQRAQLQENLSGSEAEVDELKVRLEKKGNDQQQLLKEWQNLWSGNLLTPPDLDTVESFRLKYQALYKINQKIKEYETAIRGYGLRIDRNVKRLNQALETLEEKRFSPGESYGIFQRRCKNKLKNLLDLQAKKNELEKQLKDKKNKLERSKKEQTDAQKNLAKWRTEWKSAVAKIRLGEASTPKEANTVLNRIQELFTKIDATGPLKTRRESISKDRAKLEQAVGEMTQSLAPELKDTPVEEAVDRLASRISEENRKKALRNKAEEALEKAQGDRAEAADIICRRDEELEELCREAFCSTADELETREKLSRLAQELSHKITPLTERIRDLGAGKLVEEFIEEVAGINPDEIPLLREDCHNKKETLRLERDELVGQIALKKNDFAQMNGGDQAVRIKEDIQAILARLSEEAGQYMKLRLAYVVLQKEIERYRQRNQAPLLIRAAEFFKAMTLNGFRGLDTELDENNKPYLVGLRSEGENHSPVTVLQMSDGTRDQLYFALRLAYLEKHNRENQPFPIILDDVLIRFDDERTRAALKVLVQASPNSQKILFTHHPRVLELAQAALSENDFQVHRLSA